MRPITDYRCQKACIGSENPVEYSHCNHKKET